MAFSGNADLCLYAESDSRPFCPGYTDPYGAGSLLTTFTGTCVKVMLEL